MAINPIPPSAPTPTEIKGFTAVNTGGALSGGGVANSILSGFQSVLDQILNGPLANMQTSMQAVKALSGQFQQLQSLLTDVVSGSESPASIATQMQTLVGQMTTTINSLPTTAEGGPTDIGSLKTALTDNLGKVSSLLTTTTSFAPLQQAVDAVKAAESLMGAIYNGNFSASLNDFQSALDTLKGVATASGSGSLSQLVSSLESTLGSSSPIYQAISGVLTNTVNTYHTIFNTQFINSTSHTSQTIGDALNMQEASWHSTDYWYDVAHNYIPLKQMIEIMAKSGSTDNPSASGIGVYIYGHDTFDNAMSSFSIAVILAQDNLNSPANNIALVRAMSGSSPDAVTLQNSYFASLYAAFGAANDGVQGGSVAAETIGTQLGTTVQSLNEEINMALGQMKEMLGIVTTKVQEIEQTMARAAQRRG